MTGRSVETAMWERLVRAIEHAPGADRSGLTAEDRALLGRFVTMPSRETWLLARHVHVTPTHTLHTASMRHCDTGLYGMPTPAQAAAAIELATDEHFHPRAAREVSS